MPNWCYTDITFVGEKSEIERFHRKVKDWTSTSAMETYFGDDWLGNILIGAGMKDRIDAKDETRRIRCRGEIIDMDDEVYSFCDGLYSFSLKTETAWSPMMKLWKEVLKRLCYNSIEISYLAEEPGMEIYEKYDPNGVYSEDICIDPYVDFEDNDDVYALYEMWNYQPVCEAMIRDFQNVLEVGEGVSNINTLIEMFNNNREKFKIGVHRFLEPVGDPFSY